MRNQFALCLLASFSVVGMARAISDAAVKINEEFVITFRTDKFGLKLPVAPKMPRISRPVEPVLQERRALLPCPCQPLTGQKYNKVIFDHCPDRSSSYIYDGYEYEGNPTKEQRQERKDARIRGILFLTALRIYALQENPEIEKHNQKIDLINEAVMQDYQKDIEQYEERVSLYRQGMIVFKELQKEYDKRRKEYEQCLQEKSDLFQ